MSLEFRSIFCVCSFTLFRSAVFLLAGIAGVAVIRGATLESSFPRPLSGVACDGYQVPLPLLHSIPLLARAA